MDYHHHARLTMQGREQLAKRVLEGRLSLREAAAERGLSRQTVANWVRRYREGGAEDLRDRSSRPHRLRQPTSPELVARVEVLRRERWTGFRIALATGLSRATVSRILRRLKLNRVRDLDPPQPVFRYEHAAAGDLLHLDIKKLARIERPSHRVTGDRRDTVRGIGSEAVHVAIDDHSRIAFSAIYPDERIPSVLAFLRDAVAYYARFGIHFKAVLTDNGPAYCFLCLRRSLQGAGAQAPPHTALHSTHQWKGGTLHPDRPARVGLRPYLPELRTTQPGASPLAAPVQLAPTSC